MSMKTVVLVLSLACFAAAGAWCQEALYVKVPVQGLHYQASVQETFSYRGAVHLYWVAGGADAARWTVVGALEADGSALFCGRGASFRGFAVASLTGAPGDVVPLDITFWARGVGDSPWFQGRMRILATVPTGAPY